MSNIDWGIIDRFLEKTAFFVDAHDHYEVFAEYQKANGCLHFHPVNSKDFESTLRMWYRNQTGEYSVPSLQPVIQYIQDEAIFNEDLDEVTPLCRVAGNLRDGIEFFLADRGRNVVQVRNGTWAITNQSEHKFLTTASHLPQVVPKVSSRNIFELLQPCFNVSGDDLLLLTIWLIQCFSGGSHYGIMLSAERGSGKSTLTRTVNALVDPSKATATIMQSKLEDLQTFLGGHYLACFDNVRKIPPEFSDTLAVAITGGTVAKRRLYSDRDIVYMYLHNAVIINGIDIIPTESDLAERLLYFRLKKLPPSALKADYDINKYVTENRAEILGCIFETLSKASVIIHNANPKNPTRMAEAYSEMFAIASALGICEADFHRIITANIKALHRACANTPLVEAIREYMNGPANGTRKVSCSSTAFFTRVVANYSGPKSALGTRAADFSKRLKAEHDALYAVGFQSIVDDTGADGSTITIIREKK